MINKNETKSYGSGIRHTAARPMKTFVDRNGVEWLCDANINPIGNFEGQGCWRVDRMEFDRNF